MILMMASCPNIKSDHGNECSRHLISLWKVDHVLRFPLNTFSLTLGGSIGCSTYIHILFKFIYSAVMWSDVTTWLSVGCSILGWFWQRCGRNTWTYSKLVEGKRPCHRGMSVNSEQIRVGPLGCHYCVSVVDFPPHVWLEMEELKLKIV